MQTTDRIIHYGRITMRTFLYTPGILRAINGNITQQHVGLGILAVHVRVLGTDGLIFWFSPVFRQHGTKLE